MRHAIALVLTASLTAQGQTFVVDASSGAGTNFTDIQTAVQAVPSGSTLIVRPGTYSPVVISGKGLTVLCDQNVIAWGNPFLTIQSTQPQQSVTVRALGGDGSSGLVIQSALGPVTYDGAGHSIVASWSWPVVGLTVTASNQVAISNLSSSGSEACRVSNSSLVCERCSFHGADAFFLGPLTVFSSHVGMRLTNSQVQLVQTNVTGGDGLTVFTKVGPLPIPGRSAIEMTTGSTLRVMGEPSHLLQGGLFASGIGRHPAIVGSGVARVDPLVTVSTPLASTTISLTRPTMPSVVSAGAGLGGNLTATRYGSPGLLCAMLISLRAPSTSVPWLQDPIWVDGQNFVVEAMAVTPASASFAVQKAVPSQPALRGFHFLWQAVDLDPTGILAISNPSPSVVR
jgi:hypothetical protein